MTNTKNFEPLAVPVAVGSLMIGTGRTKTLELIRDKELESILIGRKRLILLASIHQFIERQRSAQS